MSLNYEILARDLTAPAVLSEGVQRWLGWFEICKILASKGGDCIQIIDSAIIENGEVSAYIYTSSDATIKRKPRQFQSLSRVKDEFLKIFNIIQKYGTAVSNVAILNKSDSPAVALNLEALNLFVTNAGQLEGVVVQAFLPSKGNPSFFRTYRAKYALDNHGSPLTSTERLDVRPEVTGSQRTMQSLRNKSHSDDMERVSKVIVAKIETFHKCRVSNLLLDFVQDVNQKLWLQSAHSCVIFHEKRAQRVVSSPEKFKHERISKAADFGENGRADALSEGFLLSRPTSNRIGRHSDKRLEDKIHRDLPPDDAVVNSIIKETNDHAYSKGSFLQRLSPLKSRHKQGEILETVKSDSNLATASSLYHTMQIPNARLGTEVPIAEGTSMFGTSQLEGCMGDFCNFDVGYLEGIEIFMGMQDQKNLSDFRKRLMMIGDSAGLEGGAGMNSHLTRLMKKKGGAESSGRGPSTRGAKGRAGNALSRSVGAEPSTKETGGDGEEDRSTHSSEARLRHDAHRSASSTERPQFKISYSSIIQARQEMPLVKLQLRRHKSNEEGDYVTEDSYADIAVAGKLPAHYYQDVPCCGNCFKIYNIVNDARTRALHKIMKNRERNRGPVGGEGSVTSSATPSRGLSAVSGATPATAGTKHLVPEPTSSQAAAAEHLKVAMEAISSLTKLDVAEIRTMVKPPPAVEVVLEAVMCLLAGKVMSFQDTKRLLGGGEAFLTMLREFRLDDVTDARLRLVEPYVDNPVFRPENVQGVSYCASKFCAWVLGVVQAKRWQRGLGHKRINFLSDPSLVASSGGGSASTSSVRPNRLTKEVEASSFDDTAQQEDLTFVQKLEKKRAKRQQQTESNQGSNYISRERDAGQQSISKGKFGSQKLLTRDGQQAAAGLDPMNSRVMSASSGLKSLVSPELPAEQLFEEKRKKLSDRDKRAVAAAQKKNVDRLASHNKSEGNFGSASEFRCSDGITKMPFMVLGGLSLNVKRCNFIVVHDFFDTCDSTAIIFKPIVQRHEGCQALCFNYPGQANTVWPRLPAAERDRGAREPVLNNDWIADRMHELLLHAEERGEILLSSPFHLVGVGNGAAIAAAFSQRWGSSIHYSNSLRSVVAVNGFLYPDPQLSAILHSATQIFESTPHSRPDIPVSFWCRYIFSEDYLGRVNPNLAINIHTAVSNPITNEGRSKIAKGCLHHRDLRHGLAPDHIPTRGPSIGSTRGDDEPNAPVQVPVIVVQSTENMLVNPSNVDNFLTGRAARHLWSHQLNVLSGAVLAQANDVTAQWVGKLSSSAADYQKFSILGKSGLKMLLETLGNPRGAFVMWNRAGHALYQENKAALLDLFDVLACPTDEYAGFSALPAPAEQPAAVAGVDAEEAIELLNVTSKMEVMFKLVPPKKAVVQGLTVAEAEADEAADATEAAESGAKKSPASTAGMHLPPIVQTPRSDSSSPTKAVAKSASTSIDFTAVETKPPQVEVKEEPEANKSHSHGSILPPIATAAAPTVPETAVTAKPAVNAKTAVVAESTVLTVLDEPTDTTKTEVTVTAPVYSNVSPAGEEKHSVTPPARISQESEVNSFPGAYGEQKQHLIDENSSVKIEEPSASRENSKADDIDEALFAGIAMAPIPNRPTIPQQPLVSTRDQRKVKEWTPNVLDTSKTVLLEEELAKRQEEFHETEMRMRQRRGQEAEQKIRRFEEEQAARRKQYEDEDRQLLLKLEKELEARRRERELAEKQRRLQIQELESALIHSGIIDKKEVAAPLDQPQLIREMPPMEYEFPGELPSVVTEGKDANSVLSRMLQDEEDARKKGIMSMDQYEVVKMQMAQRQMERDQLLRHMSMGEQDELYMQSAATVQRIGRGHIGRKRAKAAEETRKLRKKMTLGFILWQAVIRGFIARKFVRNMKRIYMLNLMRGSSVILIQSAFRGHVARKYFKKLRRHVNARHVQRTFRGHLGRQAANRERARLLLLKRKQRAAATIQSAWRMKIAKEEFRSMRIHMLAAIELQRTYRGYLGRKKMNRRRKWDSTTPGPDRIKLGLEMIEESKVAFERQQEEIDALHRAQERAEARVSHIHAELKESEKELLVLERELQEIDQIEHELQTLTHERDVLISGVRDAAGMPRTAVRGHDELVMGMESSSKKDPDLERRRKAEAYALEMTIQIKRAEREKKRQELETEFAAVFQEVEKKKKALERLEVALADMESTRERKDREFRRLQKNLMQLLLEQKQELDDLREKGIELETATATTAAAATATALKAKEHEKRSTAMFSQTEELMKFQFMSMSLSYFSSLNMLKQLRDMNSDTTSAAIASSADAAAAAAAAASAANLPSVKKLDLGANDFVDMSIQKKKAELMAAEYAEKEAKKLKALPMPDNVRLWSVTDVCRWLESLSLGQYAPAFREATVDGPFLLELREEDMVQVLGMTHKLHVRKIVVSREKLRPLNEQESAIKQQVEREEKADENRKEIGLPDLDTVFSQARNGRVKRVEESLNLGFNIDSEDERGNTLLLVACQNSNKRLVEMLLVRGAKINHQNAQGNTALHFALSFDSDGTLGEYLIERGADDSLENIDGLTAYDGVA